MPSRRQVVAVPNSRGTTQISLEKVRQLLVTMAESPEIEREQGICAVIGASSPQRRQPGPERKTQRRNSANDVQMVARMLDKSLSHNIVRISKPRWCVVCTTSTRVDGKQRMQGHTTSFKCEPCNATLCCCTQFPCFRMYHSAEFLEHTPRQSRAYPSPHDRTRRSTRTVDSGTES